MGTYRATCNRDRVEPFSPSGRCPRGISQSRDQKRSFGTFRAVAWRDQNFKTFRAYCSAGATNPLTSTGFATRGSHCKFECATKLECRIICRARATSGSYLFTKAVADGRIALRKLTPRCSPDICFADLIRTTVCQSLRRPASHRLSAITMFPFLSTSRKLRPFAGWLYLAYPISLARIWKSEARFGFMPAPSEDSKAY